MSKLIFIMTIQNICDGDKQPSYRHKYTLSDMIMSYDISQLKEDTTIEWITI